jgi:crotonobetainyl-CoA:carnitine CoA-transferase CaiB-like acyl-CoA transferase
MSAPLDGIRVFDLTMYMAGPWGSMLLGSLGAEVLHVEQPDVDWSTLNAGAPPLIRGTASGYVAWNMNKRGLSLDLKRPADLQFAYDLIETCDVFTTNMRPLDRLGMSYEKLHEINPRLVYCHATGFGRSGPRGAERCTDAIMQGFAGGWSTQGVRDGQGEFYRHATQIDATTGNLLVQGVLLGLLARKRTGEGQFVEVTMVDAAATMQLPRLAEHLSGTQHHPQGSSAHATAPDRAFLCEDGLWIGVSVTSPDEWRRLCDAVGKPDLATDERFVTNVERVEHRGELEELLAACFAGQPRAYWQLMLDRARVPWGAPLRWEHLRHHAQVLDNDYLVEVETDAWGTVWTGGPPWRFSRTPAHMSGPPIPGIHTEQYREELERTEEARR